MARRNTTRRIIGLALLAGGAFAAGRLGLIAPNAPLTPLAGAAQPEHDHDHDENEKGEGMDEGMGGPPDMMEMMAAFEEAGRPGEYHEMLDFFAGTWDAQSTFWMDPDQPPMEMEGTMEFEWILGGRYLKETLKSGFMGEPFEGLGFWGYDNTTGKFVGAWMDTMNTGIMASTGSVDESGKVFTMWGEMASPMGGTVRFRHVITIINDDEATMEFFEAYDGQSEMTRMGLVVYTRQ